MVDGGEAEEEVTEEESSCVSQALETVSVGMGEET